MRKVLVVVVSLEAVALLALAVAVATGALERFRRDPPAVPVFRVPLANAVIGDFVRYERRHSETGETLGYLEYRVETAVEYRNAVRGREFVLELVRTDARGGARRMRKLIVQPSHVLHGFLPPRFELDEAYPEGAKPVIRTIETAPVVLREFYRDGELRQHTVPGFRVDAVRPRESVTEVKERFWIAPEVPVFGVARWERDDEVLVLHRSEKK